MRPADLVPLDVLVNGAPVDALARLVKKRDRQATVQVRRSGGRMVAVVTIELAALRAWARG